MISHDQAGGPLHRSLASVLADAAGGAAADLFPGYFAIVMATGAVSIASHLLGLEPIGWVLLTLNVVFYGALCALTALRALRYPRRILADLVDHARGPGFFTLVAGTCVFGTQLFVVAAARDLAEILWFIGLVLWAVIMYAFFMAVTIRRAKPDLKTGINGAWLLAAVATQSISVLGTLLAGAFAEPRIVLFVTLCMYFLGCLLYLSIITLIFYRLTFIRLTTSELTPPYWINMGAVAITTLAGSSLILGSGKSDLLLQFLPFLKGFTLFFWTAATWWIPLLFALMVWRHVVMRHPLRYEPQFWGMVFPLGMYTTGTLRLSQALDLPFLMIIPIGFVGIALLVWAVTAAGLVLTLWRGLREALSQRAAPAPRVDAHQCGHPPPRRFLGSTSREASMSLSIPVQAWRGDAPLWRVYWLYGVLGSLVLTLALAIPALEGWLAWPALAAALAIALAYTAWILVSTWRCAFNVATDALGVPRDAWSMLARWLTVAWAINALGLSTILIESAIGA